MAAQDDSVIQVEVDMDTVTAIWVAAGTVTITDGVEDAAITTAGATSLIIGN